MHDVQIQIRCQRCGDQMELKDPGPDDPWTPQQFWECPACGRHFWTTYPPPKKPAPQKPAPPAKTGPTAAAGSKTAAGEAATPAEPPPPAVAKSPPEPPSDQPPKTASEKS